MQLFPILLFLPLFTYPEIQQLDIIQQTPTLHLLTYIFIPYITIAYLLKLKTKSTLKALATFSAHNATHSLAKAQSLYRLTILIIHATGIYLGSFNLAKSLTPNIPLLPELLILTPPLAMLCFAYYCYHPIENHFKQSTLITALDRGQPIYPNFTPAQYVLAQFRHQIAITLIPLLLIYIYNQFTENLNYDKDYEALVHLPGPIAIFIFAPLILKNIWQTVPLPNSPLRTSLLNLCKKYKIKITQILLWQTNGSLINAAVIGLIPQIRYILMSDALLDQLSEDQTKAVMAHEIAHIKFKHMLTLGLSAFAAFILAERIAFPLTFYTLTLFNQSLPTPYTIYQDTINIISLIPILIIWYHLFGYASRRMERQADTFAVIHLSQENPNPESPNTITQQAAQTMQNALGAIAKLNHSKPEKHTWRHGSITSRQNYLQTLPNTPQKTPKVYKTVKYITLFSLLIVILTIAYEYALSTQ